MSKDGRFFIVNINGIILAVVIFLLIGLGTFVFANPSNESLNGNDNNSNNNNDANDNNDNLDDENTNDGSGEEGGEENTPNTDSDRGNSNGGSGSNNGDSSDELGQGGSNPGTGEKPSTPSENVPDKPEKIKVVITGIEDGKIYGSAVTPNISSDGIKNITLNNEAFTSGTKIADDGEYTLVVTDNNDEKTTVSFIIDTTAPKFNVSSGLHSDKAISIEITDLTLDYVIIYNQDKDEETKVNKSEFILEEEATYKLTAVDKLGNETTVWVAIDKTKPDIKVSGTNAIENKFGGEVTLTVFDKFLTEVVVNNVVYTEEDFTSEGNNENRTLTLTYEYDSKNSGTYTVSAKDKFGHINTDEFTVDNDAPESKWVYILSADEDNRTIIGNNQKLIVEINVNEELAENPVITIGDWTGELTRRANDSRYIYSKTITIDAEEMKLVHDENIKFTIEVTDIFGNTTTLDNDNVTYHEENGYGQVKYDGEAPELINLGITGYTSEAEFDAHYVKNGKGIRILAYFNELLAVNPTITINGYEYTAFKATDDGKNSYSYFVDIPDISTLDLTDGIIKFTVSGYEDKIGNVGDTKTEEDITLSKYNKVIVDNTLPEFNFTNGDTFSKFTVKITEENIARLEVYSYGTGKTTTYEGEEALTWELTDGNCMYKLTAYDLAGNMDEIWIYHDRTAPSVTGTGKVASKDVEFIPGNKYQEVNLVVTDNDLKEVKIVNQLTNEEEVICKFNWDNTQDCAVTYDKEGKYQLVVTDRANNSSTYELIIDTTAPEFDLSQIPTEFEVGVDVYKYPQPGRVTDNMDGTLSFSNVNMNWYQKNADGTKGNSTKCFGYDNWNTSLNSCSLGDYIVTYDIRDEAGNKAYVKKTITLKDTTPATLTFNREDGYVVDLGSDYQELGATISDNVDETKAIMPRVYVRFDLQMNNLYEYYDKIDTTKEGMYLAVFDYTDGAGNASSTLKRWVVVKDISAPVITGIEDNTTYFAGIGSHGYKVGGIRPKFSDNSGYMKIEIDGKTWTVDYNNSDSYNLFVKEGMPYHEILDGVDICAIDNTGNKECVENVTIIDFNSTDFADVLAQGGKIVLPPDVTINLNGNVNIPAGTTIIGDASTKLIGSLTLTGNDITLQNVNVENDSGASITINNDVQNIVIEGGSYTTTDASLQGQGTIRGMGNNTVSISNATLRGGIHLFNYAGSNDDLKDNNITLDYQGDTALSGVVITTNEEGKYSAQTIYTGNRFFIQNQPNSYYVLIQRPDWSTIDSVAINN